MTQLRMPTLFLGHGSPMNVLEENIYTQVWRKLGNTLPEPKAILAISAHWYTRGTAVTAMAQPRTIHDFSGFPQALSDTYYRAPGSPALAKKVAALLLPLPVVLNQEWGLDHGSWGVLIKMYPQAHIPVVQISIDATKQPLWHYQLGQKLAALRDEGVMIIASGNVVHNLRMLQWQGNHQAWPWALAFNQYVRNNLSWQGPADQHPLVNFMQHEDAALANPTPVHYLPLLYVLGCRQPNELVTVLLDGNVMAALSMLSVQIG